MGRAPSILLVVIAALAAGCAHDVIRIGASPVPVATSGASAETPRAEHDSTEVSPVPVPVSAAPVAGPVRIPEEVPRYGEVPSGPLPRYATLPRCRALFGRGPRYDDYQRCDGTHRLEGPWPSVFTVAPFLRLDDGADHAELHP